jgi:hypothetical protein
MNLFYLQDSRNYTGNCMSWWKLGGGYTTDLSMAQTFSQEAAQRQHNSRESDIPWSKDYIDGLARPTVDMQKAKKDSPEMLGNGIVYEQRKHKSYDQIRCGTCHCFISSVQLYCEPCPRCGTENAP